MPRDAPAMTYEGIFSEIERNGIDCLLWVSYLLERSFEPANGHLFIRVAHMAWVYVCISAPDSWPFSFQILRHFGLVSSWCRSGGRGRRTVECLRPRLQRRNHSEVNVEPQYQQEAVGKSSFLSNSRSR